MIKSPPRPNVSDAIALDGLERIVSTFIMKIAASESSTPRAYVNDLRDIIVAGASQEPITDPHEHGVLEHLDWMLATAAAGLPE